MQKYGFGGSDFYPWMYFIDSETSQFTVLKGNFNAFAVLDSRKTLTQHDIELTLNEFDTNVN